jgi:hypothetical protein
MSGHTHRARSKRVDGLATPADWLYISFFTNRPFCMTILR